jgi:hypothetical protein
VDYAPLKGKGIRKGFLLPFLEKNFWMEDLDPTTGRIGM